mmetsp:Transcript_33988/g.64942  ORF Transcript_33988/g.64942 Transcript_33988/m.64942 type:complete len:444 (-) Transcript_33988:396-1727(-)|eukprot:CAMPEP_0114241232 /NCGR_PEP_ID=MMETSP0058-20121206/9526_1 /TAXON_ID=36894 /ORGANISM="Pyramimonas parkeae, CCMP726" /LENGTH=443 /DNA_ID=CAMNT_0001353751 /DNA_START=45 /DNA_END=1376 /DNA_ORIENTATION=-
MAEGAKLRRRVKVGDAKPEEHGIEKDEKTELLVNQTARKKWTSFRTRTTSTIGMLGGFVGIIYLGHVFIWMLVLVIQTVMVHELFKLAQHLRAEKKLPGFRFLQWYFFVVVTFFTHIRYVKSNMWVEISSIGWKARMFGWVLKHDAMISYLSYIAGFVMFVASLKKNMYVYQFGQYAWTHMILLVIVLQSSCFVANIFEGIWWFLMPTLLVILNDIMAYLSGFFFGRTPLTSLSPKKTWEGFIGAFFSTMIVSFYLGLFMAKFKWLTCPRTDLQIWGWMDCDVSSVYQTTVLQKEELMAYFPSSIAQYVAKVFIWQSVEVAPIQLHSLVLSMFASIIAPFGGFFASGFKRAFKIKDFGDSIPGHGGLTDRMDCQVIMAVFANIYYNTAVKQTAATIASVIQTVETLAPEARVELYIHLGNMLVGDNLIKESELPDLTQLRIRQ